ncbi:hypothetical protein D7W82_14115 [Corallococcus sp. CA049B]|uniref:hypothetical protein n=1 Tax=Corallococcus sp. CA049B TaxID=2316730 RepID=UPI000EA39E89|nr:hypothetical protein [Corallococcus sp. CA049B]RKG87237.1 hypothetical protein D7W82_14115 [Corallococcus sp. CA049B]
MAGPPKEIRTKFAGIGLDTDNWVVFEQQLARCHGTTLTIIRSYLMEIVGTCKDAAAWDRVFWLVERTRHKPPRSFDTLTPLKTVAKRLFTVSAGLLEGASDLKMQKAYLGLNTDFGEFHQSYKDLKAKHLSELGVAPKATSSKPETFESRVDRTVDRVASGKKKKSRYSGLAEADMRHVEVIPGDRDTWIDALVRLTALRKRMQGAELAKVAQYKTEDGWFHILTEVRLGNSHSGVWIHNSKKKNGEGATRVISFVDKDGKLITPEVASAEALDGLRIADLSYAELYALLEEVESRFFGDSAGLARLLCFLLGTGEEVPMPTANFLEKTLLYQPKLKAFGQKRTVVEGPAHLTVEAALVSFLAVLFVTEPRHSLPIWISNADALQCIARTRLTFYDLLHPNMTFAAEVRPYLQLDFRSEQEVTSIGTLLASANTAKYTLSPEEEHTRKLKELIMPACELYFKHGNVNGMKTVVDSMGTKLFQAEEDDNQEDDLFDRSAKKQPKVKDSVWFTEFLDWGELDEFGKNNKKIARDYRGNLIRMRQLTFVAPVAKMLVLREILDS